jgi:hypothetical protein
MTTALMKPPGKFATAWMLIILGFVTILGSPVLVLSLFPVGFRWIDFPCVYEHHTQADALLRLVPFMLAGAMSVFGGVLLRQRSQLDK